jgi:hypothetical protein
LSQDTPVPEPEPEPEPEPLPGPPATAPQDPAPVALLAPESAAESGSEPSAGSADVIGNGPEPGPYKPWRRGRTTTLIAGAAVLGVLAGGGLGYRVQSDRAATPLPPLTGPVLAQPKGTGRAAPVLPASQDQGAIYSGDLLALLVPAPKGAEEVNRSWVSLLDYADGYTRPAGAFEEFAGNHFQRSAQAEWTAEHEVRVDVHLTQFRDDDTPYAPTFFLDQQENLDNDPQYGSSHAVPGLDSAYVWGSAKPAEAGYLPVYYGAGEAQIGDIDVEVGVQSLHPVKPSAVMSVIEKQLERL